MTPSDVSEELMRATDDPTATLQKLIQALAWAMEKAAVENEISPENEILDDNSEESPSVAVISEYSSSN
ncbi:hypothetical protein SUGI_1187590 [Cryptomeria japonica]|nr:hypothetical protein SUGI_1187590 [Cryptomeria japonica]